MREEPLSIALIVAYDRRRAIGKAGQLPWHLPADLRRFRMLTFGHPVLMGRRTMAALGRALPGRRNLVLSRSTAPLPEGFERVSCPEQVVERVRSGTLWVIGGEQVYRLFLPLAERLEITEVETETDGADAWFPPIECSQWEVVRLAMHPADDRHAYSMRFLSLRRRREGGSEDSPSLAGRSPSLIGEWLRE